MQESDASAVVQLPTPADGASAPIGAEFTDGPDWDQEPHGSRCWKFDLAYIPTTLFHDNDDMGDAVRFQLARESPDGSGHRARLWWFQQDIGPGNISAATFTYDFTRRVQFERGELTFGWGPMAAYLVVPDKWCTGVSWLDFRGRIRRA